MLPLLLGLGGAVAAMRGSGAIETLAPLVAPGPHEIFESLHLCIGMVLAGTFWKVRLTSAWSSLDRDMPGWTNHFRCTAFLIWIYIFCCSLWHAWVVINEGEAEWQKETKDEAESRKETKNPAPICENFDGVRYKLGEGPPILALECDALNLCMDFGR